MQIKYTFKHLEPLTSIETYAADHIAKIEKYGLHKQMKVHFIFSVQKNDQIAEVNVDCGGIHHTATAKDQSLYAAIDAVVEKLSHQLLKEKEKITNHHRFELSNEGYLRQELAEQARVNRVEQEELEPPQYLGAKKSS